MGCRITRPLLFVVLAFTTMGFASVRTWSSTGATNYKSTVVAEVICHASTPVSGATPSPVASPSPVAVEFDQIYLDLMIKQQARLLAMALVAGDRANSTEVKTLSQQIIDGVEPALERLQDTRKAWFDDQPVLQATEMLNALDEIGRQQPSAGGVPGAAEIIQGEVAVAELCEIYDDFDIRYLTSLIEQLDNGILLSQAAQQLAGRDETKVIAALVIDTDQPFKDTAIAYRDVLLQGSPIPEDQ